MQLKALVSVLPFLLFAIAAPAPQSGHDDRFDNDYTDSQKDGVFTLEIHGAEAYTGDVGEYLNGRYGGKQVVPTTLQVQRLKYEEGGVIHQEQTYQGMFALKTEEDLAVVECSLTTLSAIPAGAEVIWDVKDVNNPLANLEPKNSPAFKDVGCKKVHIEFGNQIAS